MKVISTNAGEKKLISYKGKAVFTGIYKTSTDAPIHLGKEIVKADFIGDRRVHGGVEKACYLYGFNHYPFWKAKYPYLDWDYGMFGENLTMDHLDEGSLLVGSIYQVGSAVVQISRPRQPCFKLGVRFGNQAVLRQFIDALLPGTYVKVLQEGMVETGDVFELLETIAHGISIRTIYELIFHFDSGRHTELAKQALANPFVSESDKKYIKKRMS